MKSVSHETRPAKSKGRKTAKKPLPKSVANNPDFTTPILELVKDVVSHDPDWIDRPNTLFGGEPPRIVVGTEREEYLRNIVLAYKYGIYS